MQIRALRDASAADWTHMKKTFVFGGKLTKEDALKLVAQQLTNEKGRRIGEMESIRRSRVPLSRNWVVKCTLYPK